MEFFYIKVIVVTYIFFYNMLTCSRENSSPAIDTAYLGGLLRTT